MLEFLEPFGQPTDCLGILGDDLCIKLCFGVYEAENDHGIRFFKVEPMCVEWAAHGQPTVMFLGVLKNSLGWLELDQNVHVWCV